MPCCDDCGLTMSAKAMESHARWCAGTVKRNYGPQHHCAGCLHGQRSHAGGKCKCKGCGCAAFTRIEVPR